MARPELSNLTLDENGIFVQWLIPKGRYDYLQIVCAPQNLTSSSNLLYVVNFSDVTLSTRFNKTQLYTGIYYSCYLISFQNGFTPVSSNTKMIFIRERDFRLLNYRLFTFQF